MLESGIYVRDFGTRLEEIKLANSANKILVLVMHCNSKKQNEWALKHFNNYMQTLYYIACKNVSCKSKIVLSCHGFILSTRFQYSAEFMIKVNELILLFCDCCILDLSATSTWSKLM